MRNLFAAIYRQHELYLIQCETSQESLKLEKYLKKKLSPRNIRGEWFASVKPECVQSLLVDDFGHLLLINRETVEPPPVSKVNAPLDFNIQLN
jgi:hypothetical protein